MKIISPCSFGDIVEISLPLTILRLVFLNNKVSCCNAIFCAVTVEKKREAKLKSRIFIRIELFGNNFISNFKLFLF